MPLAQADRDPSRVPQQCKMRRLTSCVPPILSLAVARGGGLREMHFAWMM
jgi:hypothetical protein